MSKEFTNYQTLLQAKINANKMFEDKLNIIKNRRDNNMALTDTYKGAAAAAFTETSDAFLNALTEAQAKANEKIDSDISFWESQLTEAEKLAAQEYRSKIGL